MTKILAADGIITENERSLLDKKMDHEALNEDERGIVLDVDRWSDAEAELAKLPESERREFLGELVEAASVDGKLSPLEAGMLKEITAALGL